MMDSARSIRSTVYISLFTALIALGAYIAVPIGPVPIVMQNFFVFLAGLLLGKSKGMAVIATYLVLGALGLPVFHSGTGGIGIILGPTGGYLLSYLPAIFIIGLISQKGSLAGDLAALLCGTLIIYLIGIPWLKTVLHFSWLQSLSAGFFPFIPGDALKIAAAIPVARLLRPVLAEANDTP